VKIAYGIVPGTAILSGCHHAQVAFFTFPCSLLPCFRILKFVKNDLEGVIPEIWETKEEKKLPTGDLKQKHFVLARNRFICNPPVVVINKDKNWPIELSRRVISEWRVKSRTRERILSIQLLDSMIEGAKFLETTEDIKNTPGIESVSYFENYCRINGYMFKINITIKTQKSAKRRFAYYFSATEIGVKK
jgi:hypothetical protein